MDGRIYAEPRRAFSRGAFSRGAFTEWGGVGICWQVAEGGHLRDVRQDCQGEAIPAFAHAEPHKGAAACL